jgi:hypothetical protein
MSRQRIIHGKELDVATPQDVAEILARQFDAQSSSAYYRCRGNLFLDSNGNGTDNKNKAPRSHDWILERIALTTTPAATGVVGIYENQVDPGDLLEIIQFGAGGIYTDSFSNCIFLPAGSSLCVNCVGGPASGQITYNVQVRLQKANYGQP